MLKVKVDIVPFGMELDRSSIAEMTIINDGTGTPDIGNYKVAIVEKGKKSVVTLKGHKRSEGALALIRDVLIKKGKRRNE